MAVGVALGVVAGVWGNCHIVFTVLNRDSATIHQLSRSLPLLLDLGTQPRYTLLVKSPWRYALEMRPGDSPWRHALETSRGVSLR